MHSENITYPAKEIMIVSPEKSAKHATAPEGMATIPAVSTTMTIEYNLREPGGYGNIKNRVFSVCQRGMRCILSSLSKEKRI